MGVGTRITFAARLALLPVSLALAALAFLHAASENGMPSPGPAAQTWFGLNAQALAKQTDRGFRAELARQSASGEMPRLPDDLLELARASFSVNPLEVSSLRTIVLGNSAQNDLESTRRAMQLAVQISKRDSVVNLWRAQDFGSRGDVEATIAAFDQAMRTSRRVREVAMRPLVNTLASEESFAPLGELLQTGPDWEGAFWREFAQNPVAYENGARFLAGSGVLLTRMPEFERLRLYANLKRAGQFDTLYRLAALDPSLETKAAELADGAFVTVEDGYPLGWTLYSRGNYSSQLPKRSGELQIDAKAGAFGIAADRVFRPAAGRNFVVALAEPLPQSVELKLVATCVSGELRHLGTLTLSSGARGGHLALPADACASGLLQVTFAVDPGRRDSLIRVASIVQKQP